MRTLSDRQGARQSVPLPCRHDTGFRRRSRRASAHHQGHPPGGLAGRPGAGKADLRAPVPAQIQCGRHPPPSAACRYRTAPEPSADADVLFDAANLSKWTATISQNGRAWRPWSPTARGSTFPQDQRRLSATRKSMSSSRSPISPIRRNPQYQANSGSFPNGPVRSPDFGFLQHRTYRTAGGQHLPSFPVGECRAAIGVQCYEYLHAPHFSATRSKSRAHDRQLKLLVQTCRLIRATVHGKSGLCAQFRRAARAADQASRRHVSFAILGSAPAHDWVA